MILCLDRRTFSPQSRKATVLGRGLMLNGLDGRFVRLAHATLIALETRDAAERYLAGEGVFDAALTPNG